MQRKRQKLQQLLCKPEGNRVLFFKALNSRNKQTKQGGIYTQVIYFSKNYTKQNIFGQINAK